MVPRLLQWLLPDELCKGQLAIFKCKNKEVCYGFQLRQLIIFVFAGSVGQQLSALMLPAASAGAAFFDLTGLAACFAFCGVLPKGAAAGAATGEGGGESVCREAKADLLGGEAEFPFADLAPSEASLQQQQQREPE